MTKICTPLMRDLKFLKSSLFHYFEGCLVHRNSVAEDDSTIEGFPLYFRVHYFRVWLYEESIIHQPFSRKLTWFAACLAWPFISWLFSKRHSSKKKYTDENAFSPYSSTCNVNTSTSFPTLLRNKNKKRLFWKYNSSL